MLYPATYGNPIVVKTGIYDFSAYTVADVSIVDKFGISKGNRFLSKKFFGAVVFGLGEHVGHHGCQQRIDGCQNAQC